MTSSSVKQLALECGFELAGVAEAIPTPDADRYLAWATQGMAGKMEYLTDRRANIRQDPRQLLPSAKSIICVAKLYNHSNQEEAVPYSGYISRYARGEDYHDV